MATIKIRHLVALPGKAGSTRWYWRPAAPLKAAGWKDQRLPEDEAQAMAAAEGLNAEVDAWRQGATPPHAPAAAAKRNKAAAVGSVEALVIEYKRSRWWLKLADRTRKDYGGYLDTIIAWAGDMPARAITGPAVEAFYAAQLRRVEGSGRKRKVVMTPAKAHAAIRVLRLLLAVGERLGYLKKGSNPAAQPGISLVRAREPVIWSRAQVLHMAATADRLGWRSVATAMLLNEWIGQREADILKLKPWRVETDALVIRQGKTGRVVRLPVYLVPHLVQRLAAEASRDGAVTSLTHLLLHEGTGSDWNEHTFRHVFAEIREAAAKGLPATVDSPELLAMPSCADLRFMELRHTAVTRLNEAGEDALGIAGVTGHSPKTCQAILDRHYLARTEKAAEGAFRKRLAAERRT